MNVVLTFTGLLGVSRGVGFGHRINVHKLLLKDGQQEGEAVIQTDVQDELRKRRTSFSSMMINEF